jgi:phosphoglycolate phosphatase
VPQLVVFDLDGTLVDSLRDLAESVNSVLESEGCRQHSEADISRMVGEGAATLVARAFAASDCTAPPDALERFLRVYDSRPLRFTRPYPGVAQLLETLAPSATLAVLTNKPLAATRVILDGLQLSGYFGDLVLGGDGPWPRKPDPAGLQSLLVQAGATPADATMVGDSMVDLQTAINAGVRACLVRYGFGFRGIAADSLRSNDRVIDAPLELLKGL